MDLALVIFGTGLGTGVLVVSLAYAYRLISETRIKRKAFEVSLGEERNVAQETDDLQKRLDELRKSRFSPDTTSYRPVGSAAMAARIRKEESLNK